ncbi:hypothetical protein ASE07_21300 [Noviherbaspirillum sp. Root189]|nr:hypothetical protein ASE07_21300 [Noviherbaspirillum sp. Root189]
MPPTAKSVLISLADNANDHGVCWPSIPTIAKRTCFSERAVQNAIQWLERNLLLIAHRTNGRHTSYTLTPERYAPETAADALIQQSPSRSKCTPAAGSPVKEMRNTPTADAAVPLQETRSPPQEVPSNRKEPSKEPSGNHQKKSRDRDAVLGLDDLVVDGVDKQHARDWLTLRKAKRLPLTPSAWDAIKAEATKIDMTAAEAVACAVSSSWAGFKAKWVNDAVGGGQKPHATWTLNNADENSKAKALLFGGNKGEVIDV